MMVYLSLILELILLNLLINVRSIKAIEIESQKNRGSRFKFTKIEQNSFNKIGKIPPIKTENI